MAALDAPVKICSDQVNGGAFGTIKVGFWQGRMVAVKIQDLDSATASNERMVCMALKIAPHPNIMEVRSWWSTGNSRMIAWDWMESYNI